MDFALSQSGATTPVLEGSDWANVHKIYGLDTQARGWEVIPEALPRVFELRFEKRKKPEIEFRVPGIWIKLRFRDQADMVKRLAQYAVPSWVEEDVEDQVNAALDSAAAVAFTGTEVPRDSWRDLARYAQDLGGERLQPPESFRGGEYLAVRLGNWESVYNTRQINQAQRLALVVGELMNRVKGAGALASAGLAGLRLDVGIPYRDFVDSSDHGLDAVAWYIDSASIPALRDFEITSQEFVNSSVIVVNGTRVEVDLSDQG